MPATGAVKTLAASFEGMGGATALSLIAFSVVFLVLAGLTLVIFAMRVVSKVAGNGKAPAAVSAPAQVAAGSVPARAGAASDDELVAVIAAAIVAQTGTAMSIRSIVPAGVHLIGRDETAWIACGRIEALQGALCDRWN